MIHHRTKVLVENILTMIVDFQRLVNKTPLAIQYADTWKKFFFGK